MSKNEADISQYHHFEEAIKLIFRGLIPIIFLAGGVGLLALRLPGWSLILGIPVTIFGVVFLLYTYDEVVRGKVFSMPTRFARCAVCGKPTPILPGQNPGNLICPVCKKEVGKEA